MNLPDALRRFRHEKGVSQRQMATIACISVTQYQNYEYGKSEPTLPILIRLADYFDVTLDYLVGRSDKP